ncbi:MAG: hypothetical protein N2749_00575 [Clostridia bacterium]|nr:hypothetical protein [Clostridia bacterium]
MEKKKSIVIGVVSKMENNAICVNGNWYTLSKYPDKGVDFSKLKENFLYEFILLDNKYVINYREIKDFDENSLKSLVENNNNSLIINDESSVSNTESSLEDVKKKETLPKNKNDLVFFIRDYRIAKMNALTNAVSYAVELYKNKGENISVDEVLEIADRFFDYIFNDNYDLVEAYIQQEGVIKEILNI